MEKNLEMLEKALENKYVEYALELILTMIVASIALFALKIVVEKTLKYTDFLDEKKKTTIVAVMKNTKNYILLTVFIITAVKPFVDLKDLLVAGGVIGVVIGFGAQSLIRDFLYGFFFLFEGQFKKGDFVAVNDSLEGGVVEDLGFRAVKVRLFNGKLLTISNGEIKKIVNANIDKRRIFESIVFSYREDPKKIKEILEEFCEEMNELYEEKLYKEEQAEEYAEKFKVFGLGTIGENLHGWSYRISATVKEAEYLEVVQEVKQKLAERIYETNTKLAEQQVFYQTRANIR